MLKVSKETVLSTQTVGINLTLEAVIPFFSFEFLKVMFKSNLTGNTEYNCVIVHFGIVTYYNTAQLFIKPCKS